MTSHDMPEAVTALLVTDDCFWPIGNRLDTPSTAAALRTCKRFCQRFLVDIRTDQIRLGGQ